MPRKWFVISNGFGLLFAALVMANILSRLQRVHFETILLWPASLLLLHSAAFPVFLRGRRNWLIKLTGVLSGLAAAVSGWSAFATVGAPAPRWLGLLGLFCFFAAPVILIASICVTIFAGQEKP